jgi:hypothetical protein
MRRILLALCVFGLTIANASVESRAAVESSVEKTVHLDHAPLDVATSADGSSTFVLLEGGEVRIYSADGALKGELRVGDRAEKIAASTRGDQLFVTSRADQTLKVVMVDFVHQIDVTGSPFKGPADAPVAIAVFNDFQ